MGVLASWFAGPLVKLAAVAALVAALIGVGEWHGRQAVQQQWDASITKQAGEAMSVMIDQARNQAAAQVQIIEVKGKERVRTQVIVKEVDRYVESPAEKCVLPAEFVRNYDRFSGLYADGQDGVPAADGATGDADEPSADPPTDAAVLRAKEDETLQCRDLWLDYRALRDWVRSDYAIRERAAR